MDASLTARFGGLNPTVLQHAGVLGEADDKWCRTVALGTADVALLGDGAKSEFDRVNFSVNAGAACVGPAPGRATMAVGLAVDFLDSPTERPVRSCSADNPASCPPSGDPDPSGEELTNELLHNPDVASEQCEPIDDLVGLAQEVQASFQAKHQLVALLPRPAPGDTSRRVNATRERRYEYLQANKDAVDARHTAAMRRMDAAAARRDLTPEAVQAWALQHWYVSMCLQKSVRSCINIVLRNRAEEVLRRCFSPMYAVWSAGKKGSCTRSDDVDAVKQALVYAGDGLFDRWSDALFDRLARRATKLTLPPHSILVKQGEWVFACFILMRGSMRRRGSGSKAHFLPRPDTPVSVLNITALVCLEKSTETLVSGPDGADLWVLKACDFNRTVASGSEAVQNHVRDMRGAWWLRTLATQCPLGAEQLKRCEFFADYDEGALASLLDSSEPALFNTGDRITVQGKVSKAMYVVARGGGLVVREGPYLGTEACTYRSRSDARGAVECQALDDLDVGAIAADDLFVDADEPEKRKDEVPQHPGLQGDSTLAVRGSLGTPPRVGKRGSALDLLRQKSHMLAKVKAFSTVPKKVGMRERIPLTEAAGRHIYVLPPHVDIDGCLSKLTFKYTLQSREFIVGSFGAKAILGLHSVAGLAEEESVVADRPTCVWRVPLAFLEQPSHSVHDGWVRCLLRHRAARVGRCVTSPHFTGEHLVSTLPGMSRLQAVLMDVWEDQPTAAVRDSKARGDYEYRVLTTWRRMVQSLGNKMQVLYYTSGVILDDCVPSFVGICSTGSLEVTRGKEGQTQTTRVPFGSALFTEQEGAMWQRYRVAAKGAGCLWLVPMKDIVEMIAGMDLELPRQTRDGAREPRTAASVLQQAVAEFNVLYDKAAHGDRVSCVLPEDSVLPQYFVPKVEGSVQAVSGERVLPLASQLPANHPLILLAGAEVRCFVIEEAIKRIRGINDEYTDKRRRAYYHELHTQRKTVSRYRQRTLAQMVQWRPAQQRAERQIVPRAERWVGSPVSQMLYAHDMILTPLELPKNEATAPPSPIILPHAADMSDCGTMTPSPSARADGPLRTGAPAGPAKKRRRQATPKNPVPPPQGRDRHMTLRKRELRRRRILNERSYEDARKGALAAVHEMAERARATTNDAACETLLNKWDKIDADVGLERFFSGTLDEPQQQSTANNLMKIRAAAKVKAMLGQVRAARENISSEAGLQHRVTPLSPSSGRDSAGTTPVKQVADGERSCASEVKRPTFDPVSPVQSVQKEDDTRPGTASRAGSPGRGSLSFGAGGARTSIVPDAMMTMRIPHDISYDVDMYLRQRAERRTAFGTFMAQTQAASRAASRRASEAAREIREPVGAESPQLAFDFDSCGNTSAGYVGGCLSPTLSSPSARRPARRSQARRSLSRRSQRGSTLHVASPLSPFAHADQVLPAAALNSLGTPESPKGRSVLRSPRPTLTVPGYASPDPLLVSPRSRSARPSPPATPKSMRSLGSQGSPRARNAAVVHSLAHTEL
eukprot:TRINITY_DN16355_c0_g1_i1.p1 TRINITY_DN16355_c0_g1~~TRINITY_DN16355_c0_g1_i1.p1  ORF type:complete len:1510 (+),score=202.43 TRINITY_DN16355_c0_g1_i1:200-4729(+)